MAIDPRLLQAPGNVPPIYGAVSDLDRRVKQLEATRSVIGAGTITGGSNGSGSPTGMLAIGAVTAEIIDVGAVNAGHIQADAIDTIHLKSDIIDTEHLKANSVKTLQLDADSVTAVKIASDAIETRHLQSAIIETEHLGAVSISADKLSVTAGGNNLLKNGHFARLTGAIPDYWSLYSNAQSPVGAFDSIAAAWAKYGARVARLINSTDTTGQLGVTPLTADEPVVEGSKKYTTTAWVQPLTGTANYRIHMHWRDSSNAIIGVGNASSLFPVTATGSNGWTRITFTATSPSNAVKCKPYVWVDNPASGATFYVGAIMLQEGDLPTMYMPAVDEILPGTIFGEHISALSIDTGHLKTDAVDTRVLKADSVDTIHLKTDSVDARVIKADAVTSIEIQAGAVQTAHMTANTIDGSIITGNTLHGDKIIGTSILAEKLAVSQLSAITADMGSLTAGTITGATFQTAASGQRAMISSVGMRLINTAGEVTFHADTATGKVISLAGLGGGNLLRQTAPTPADVATLQRYTGSNPVSIAVESTIKFGDYNSWKHTADGVGIAVIYNDYTSDNIVACEAGDEFVASAYFRTSVASRGCRVRIIFYNSSNVAVGGGTFTSSTVALPVDTWTRNSVSGVAPATSAKVRTLFDFGTTGLAAPANGDVWYLGGAQLERGRLPTSYAREVGEILTNEVTGVEVAPGSITGGTGGTAHIAPNTVVPGNMLVGSLSAITADMGTLTAGSITATANINAAAINAGVMSADRITLTVGTGNLLSHKDPSFETTPLTGGWTASTGAGSIAQSTTVGGAYGTGALRLTSNATNTYMQAHCGSSAGNRIPVNPALKYSYSAMVYPTTAAKRGLLLIVWYDAAGTALTTVNPALVNITANTWNRIVYENVTPHASADSALLYVRVENNGVTYPNGEFAYVDGLMFNEGEKAAGFTMFGPTQILRTQILPGEIRANLIGADQVDATHINVTDLSAISADLGTVTAGVVTASVSVDAAAITADTLDAITADLGAVTAGTLDGVTITGSVLQTAPPGTQRVYLDANGLFVYDASNSAIVTLPTAGSPSFSGAIDANGGISQDAVTASPASSNRKHAWYDSNDSELASIFGASSAYPGVATPRLFASATAPMAYNTLVKAHANLVHYWRMGSAASQTDQVVSGAVNLALDAGTTAISTPGLISGTDTAIKNGSAGAAQFSATPGVSQNVTTGLTVEYWLQIDKLPTTDVRLVQRSNNSDGSSAEYWKSTFIQSTGKLQFSILIGGVAKTHTTSTVLSTATVYHVVHTYDGANIRTYLNGVADGTATAQTGSIDAQGTAKYRAGVIAGLDPKTTTNSPSAASSVVDVTGDKVWSGTGNVFASDNVYATSVLDGSASWYSQQLRATGFGFAVPAGATIRGVVVEAEHKGSVNSGTQYAYLQYARVIKADSSLTSNLSIGAATAIPTSDTTMSYPATGIAPLTGVTPTDVNSANFGVALRYQHRSPIAGSTAITVSVDRVRLTVYFTLSITVDEVAVYNAALNTTVITDHYQTGVTGVSTSTASVTRQIVGADGTSDFMDSNTVSTLPVSPYNGQVIQYQSAGMATDGVVWTLKYRSASASSFKWEYIGGSLLFSAVETDESTTSATYVDLTTVGPSVTIPLAGDYEITCGCYAWRSSTGAAQSYASLKVGATATSDNDKVTWSATPAQAVANQISEAGTRVFVKTGLAAGTVLKLQYRSSAGTAQFLNRWISVRPVRVG